jgi:hypothetical protein
VEAIAQGSSAAGCETYFRDDWFRAVCSGKAAERPLGVVWLAGAGAEAASVRVGDSLSILAPLSRGNSVRGIILWETAERGLELDWPVDALEPTFRIGPSRPRTSTPLAAPELDASGEACRCAADAHTARLARAPKAPPDAETNLIGRAPEFV